MRNWTLACSFDCFELCLSVCLLNHPKLRSLPVIPDINSVGVFMYSHTVQTQTMILPCDLAANILQKSDVTNEKGASQHIVDAIMLMSIYMLMMPYFFTHAKTEQEVSQILTSTLNCMQE